MPERSLIDFTQALVRQPSQSGEEGALVEIVVGEMRALGYDQAWVDGDGNAVGVVNGARSGRTLLCDGHCDTVGIAPGVPWQHDPFGAVIEGDSLFGRGVTDMKGGLAAMIHAAAGVDRRRLAGRVVVCASVMEENIEGAALKTVMDAVQPDFVVIGEPTELKLNRGGRGRAEIHLETIGRPAHSSTPFLGRNAVQDMLKVVAAMERIRLGHDPFLGAGILALTDIISEPYPAYSVIPSRCKVTYDQRLLPGETMEQVLGAITGLPEVAGIELHARIAEGEHRTYTGAVLRGTKFLPAWLLPEEHPFLQAARRGVESAGIGPVTGSYRFCTNAAYSAGMARVPTLGFGPGREEDAHVIDEQLSLTALAAAERGYRGIIEAVLSAAG